MVKKIILTVKYKKDKYNILRSMLNREHIYLRVCVFVLVYIDYYMLRA